MWDSMKILILNYYFSFLFLLISFGTNNSNCDEFKRFLINPEIDTSQVNIIFENKNSIDIYTNFAGFRFTKNFQLIKKFLELDYSKKNSIIRSVNYINDKIFVGATGTGLIVLNSELDISNIYNSANSKLKYDKSCGTVYDSVTKKYFSQNCDFGLFVIDSNNNEEYIYLTEPFLNSYIYSFDIIDDLYYISYGSLSTELNSGIYDSDFNLIQLFDWKSNYGLITNGIFKTKNFDNFIGIITKADEFILYEKNNNANYFTLASNDDKKFDWLVNSKKIGNEIFYFGVPGIYSFKLNTFENLHLSVYDYRDNPFSSHIYDITNIGNKLFIATGNGIFSKDLVLTNVLQDNYFNNYHEYNEVISIDENIKEVEIYDNLGKTVLRITGINSINLKEQIHQSGFYFVKITSINDSFKIFKYMNSK